jgi:type IV pilus assembly protein PilN
MPRINLLPWREEQRKERKLRFTVSLLGGTAAAVIAAFTAYLMFGSMIDGQERRNEMLRAEIKQLDKQIEEINSLESAKQKFIARMEIIERLQRSRPEIVHVFDTIVRTLPDGVYLTSVKQTTRKFRFDGVAQSSTRVSTYMRNIDGSEWLRNADLEVVETKRGNTVGSNFTLFAEQVSVAAEEAKAPAGKAKRGRVASTGDAR